MKRITKFVVAIFMVFLFLILSIGIVLGCISFILGEVDLEEETEICLMIPKEETHHGITSGILSSQEDLQDYLAYRAFYQRLPFEGILTIESLDFENYDYIFSEGRSIIRMQKLLWDQCSSYDHTGLMPVGNTYGEYVSHKVYIYRIKPKNKYRKECE